MGILDGIRDSFKKGSSLIKLIYINIGVFLLITLAAILAFLLSSPAISAKALEFTAVPSSLSALIIKPWTLVTYMFTHKDIWHILFNMLWLYWFGTIFIEYLDQRKLISVYLLGGLSGAILYIASYNIFPAFNGVVNESVAIGASASVMAVVVAIAAYVPDYPVHLILLGKVKIKYMALAIFVLTSFMEFPVNSGGKIAHIGGAVFGYLYTMNIRQGKDIGRWINGILDKLITLFKPRKKLRVKYKKPVTDYDYNKMKADHQAQINRILDKISKGGYDSLTREEKDILFNESRKKN